MSSHLSGEAVLYQQLLSACGFYNGLLDGDWGPKTDTADQLFTAKSEALKSIGTFDSQSQRNIAGLHIKAKKWRGGFWRRPPPAARRFGSFPATGLTKNRTDCLRRDGSAIPDRSSPMREAAQSNHNFAIAWDIGIFTSSGEYLDGNTAAEEREYKKVFDLVDGIGLEWGGNWTTIVDLPHYQGADRQEGVGGPSPVRGRAALRLVPAQHTVSIRSMQVRRTSSLGRFHQLSRENISTSCGPR